MRILRDPAEVDSLPSGLIRTLLQQRIAELSIDEPFDPAIHGYFVIVETGDVMADIERTSRCRLRSNRYSTARYGDAGFVPDWELLEFHPASGTEPGYFEFTFVLSDDGFGAVLLCPDVDGIDPELLALCRTYASSSVQPTNS